MDLYLFHQKEYQALYNCSFYSVDQIPLEKRQHRLVGFSFLTLGITLEILYIPCMFAIWKHMENPCYKIMFYIGVNDMMCMLMNAIMTGILSITGAVFCSSPTMIYIFGVYGLGLLLIATIKCY
jgi:hypothetical protein